MKQITITSTFKIVDNIPQSIGAHNSRVNQELARFSQVCASNTIVLTGLSVSEYSILTFLTGEEIQTLEALKETPQAPPTRQREEQEPAHAYTPTNENEQQNEAAKNPPGRRKPFGA